MISFFRTLHQLLQLRKVQWLKTSELEEIQQKKLSALLKHAYENVLYYHRLFDSVGIRPEEIKTVRELPKIPITTRSILMSMPKSEVTARGIDLDRCRSERTSGSHGMPFEIFLRAEDKNFLKMVWTRALMENGLSPIGRRVNIEHPNRVVTKKFWFEHLGIWRSQSISCFEDVEYQIKILREIRPELIFGVPSSIALVAMEIKKRKIEEIKPKLVITTDEFLNPRYRDLIDTVFGVKLFDFYTSAEYGLVCWECSEHKGYHINVDSVVVEFIRDGKPVKAGEKGELVCTTLHSYAMPFIRYSIGDIGILVDEKCSCGRGLPLMEVVGGPHSDYLVLPSGKIISPYLLKCTIDQIPGIEEYQIVQQKKREIIIKIMKDREFNNDTVHKVKMELRRIIGENVQVNPIIVDQVPKDKSGGFRVVVSEIDVSKIH